MGLNNLMIINFSYLLHTLYSARSAINRVQTPCDSVLYIQVALVFLPSTNEVCEGYVFTPVFHLFTMGVSMARPRGGWGLPGGGV